MRQRKKVLMICIIVGIISIICGVITNLLRQQNVTQEVIEMMKQEKLVELPKELLERYKECVEQALQVETNEYEEKENYYVLGILECASKNINEAREYLEQALIYTNSEDEKYQILDIWIYSALATVELVGDEPKQSELYFEKAIKLGEAYADKEIVSEIYYRRAMKKLRLEYDLETIIELMQKAARYQTNGINSIRNDITLAKLYRLKGEREKALKHNEKAFDEAIQLKNMQWINTSILSLAETYYIYGSYENAIYIYENLLGTGTLTNRSNLLDSYGYLADIYGKIGNYEQYEKYRDLYLAYVKEMDEQFKNKELVWLYNKCTTIELTFGHIEEARRYLEEAEKLYLQDTGNMYYNMNLYIQYNKNKLAYAMDSDYKKVIENYRAILEQLLEKGIGTDLKYIILDESINLSYKHKDYENLIHYLDMQREWMKHSEGEADQLLIKIDNILIKKEVIKAKKRMIILGFLMMLMIIEGVRIKKKNAQIKRLNLELEELGRRDALTNVYNRGYLKRVCEEIIQRRACISFIMIDVDYFKLYNDYYGHVEGDKVLVEVANTIRKVFEKDDVFRYGGEEFTVISTRTGEELIEKIEDLQVAIKQLNMPHIKSNVSNQVTISIGAWSGQIKDRESAADCIKKADQNLYQSKEDGRNRYTYSNELSVLEKRASIVEKE
ncbi:MAG: diguanylate cyclase [Cellulosilyticaceae bacterium]